MYHKILVPTDFSSYAHKVQSCLSAIPGIDEIVLLHVLDASNPKELEGKGWSWDSLIDEARSRLGEQEDQLTHKPGKELQIKTVLKVIIEPMSGADGVNLQRPKPKSGVDLVDGGSVGEVISRVAADENVSLICMGAQGKGMIEGMLLGSVSTEVLRQSEADLLIIQHGILGKKGEGKDNLCQDIFSKVMLTTDFSSAGEEAAARIKEMPGLNEILLVNVIDKENDFKQAAEGLNRLREELAASGRRITVHVLQGTPSDEILALSKKQDVSLIMMSSQGKSWSRQIRVGSTTFDVVRRAQYPVLVIRPAKC